MRPATRLVGAVLLIGFVGCGDQQKKTGLTILNAIIEARSVAIKTVKDVDIQKQAALSKRYDEIETSPSDNHDAEALKVKTIDIELLEHQKNVTVSYDFLEAIGHACEVAKVALLSGANLALVLAPVLATALDLERALAKLGIGTKFVNLITGGR